VRKCGVEMQRTWRRIEVATMVAQGWRIGSVRGRARRWFRVQKSCAQCPDYSLADLRVALAEGNWRGVTGGAGGYARRMTGGTGDRFGAGERGLADSGGGWDGGGAT
jgi:hypothetical protein